MGYGSSDLGWSRVNPPNRCTRVPMNYLIERYCSLEDTVCSNQREGYASGNPASRIRFYDTGNLDVHLIKILIMSHAGVVVLLHATVFDYDSRVCSGCFGCLYGREYFKGCG